MKILNRLLVGFLAVSLVGALIGIVGMVYAVGFAKAAEAEYQKSTLGLVYLLEMQNSFSKIRVDIIQYFHAKDANEAASYVDAIQGDEAHFQSSAKKYPPTIFDKTGIENFKKLSAFFSDYVQELNELFQLHAAGDSDATRKLFLGRMRPTETGLLDVLAEMGESNEGYAKSFAQNAAARTNDLYWQLPSLILMGLLLSILIGYLTSKSIVQPLRKIIHLAGDIAEGHDGGDGESKGFGRRIVVESKDEVGELGGTFNKLLEMLDDLLKQIEANASDIAGMVQGLSTSTQEINATANEQAAAVKEIVSTIEDTDRLSKNIADRVGEVGRIAADTKSNVEVGFATVKDNIAKMNEIHEANDRTIKGINFLGEKIKNIWDIVNIINSIADQTKIIAFNAELEASSAGEAGRNFQIVASEIRRLADSTVNSTNEIKVRIQEIERSSDSLLLSSEQGTQQIQQGKDLSQKMNHLFEDISSSTDISDSSTQQIALSIRQQVDSFGQIVIAIKQISQGVDNFVVATKGTSLATENLRNMSKALADLLRRFED
jgi:methyl-accepting chemotaxis protein